MKLRLLIACLSLAAVGAVFYVRAANNGATAANATAAPSSATCSDCDGPSPESVLPNPYKTDATKPATEATPATLAAPTAPAAPAKN